MLDPVQLDSKRSYLDAAIRLGQVFEFGTMELVPGISLRIGRLLSQDGEFPSSEFDDWVLGVDPEIRLAYGRGFLWGQFPIDLEPSVSVGQNEMGERAAYFGLGWRIL